MTREATALDGDGIEAFLSRHSDSSMFLRSNLAAHGIGDSTHDHATTFWVSGDAVTGVFGVTNSGFLMSQAPNADARDWQDFSAVLSGRKVAGMTGLDAQVIAALAAIDLPDGALGLNKIEPLYRLDFCDLMACNVTIRRPDASDEALLRHWYAALALDTGQAKDARRAAKRAKADATAAIKAGRLRLLIEDGTPVAMSNLNAEVKNMVSIGPVFVPPALRNAGRARHLVAAQMAECRGRGITKAVLFSNNDAASRAYEAIGFRQIDNFRIALLTDSQVMP